MLKKIENENSVWEEELETYGSEGSEEILTMCRKCYSFHYENGWHFERPSYLSDNDEIGVQFSQCPACIEEALAMYDMEYV